MKKLPVETKAFWCKFLKLRHECNHTFSSVKKVLRGMNASKAEITASIELLEKNGGYCDCEAWLNAAECILGNKVYEELYD